MNDHKPLHSHATNTNKLILIHIDSVRSSGTVNQCILNVGFKCNIRFLLCFLTAIEAQQVESQCWPYSILINYVRIRMKETSNPDGSCNISTLARSLNIQVIVGLPLRRHQTLKDINTDHQHSRLKTLVTWFVNMSTNSSNCMIKMCHWRDQELESTQHVNSIASSMLTI